MTDTPLDALVEELAIVAGRIEREASLRIDALLADLRRTDAERELRIARLEARLEERLSAVKDGAPGKDADPAVMAQMIAEAVASLPPAPAGKDADPAEIERLVGEHVARAVAALPKPEKGKDADPALMEQMIAEAVAALPPAAAGKDADPAEIERLVGEHVARAVAALPKPEKGKDADPALMAQMIAEVVAALPPAPAGKDGKLPVVKAWTDRVHYEGEVATRGGSTYQAVRDTGRAPPHEDWICLAAAGAPARSPRVRETYSAEIKDYRELDIVALNGAAFMARRDDPGACPGDGWQMISMQGKQGKPGERVKGEPGTKGPPGPRVEHMTVDDQGLLRLQNADGSVVECDLYPVLIKLQ